MNSKKGRQKMCDTWMALYSLVVKPAPPMSEALIFGELATDLTEQIVDLIGLGLQR